MKMTFDERLILGFKVSIKSADAKSSKVSECTANH